jgi:trehalose 6-phosphate phosphatase
MTQPPLPGRGETWALFLDVDGTLLSIADTPQAVRVEPTLLALLDRLRGSCDGALALVSGRRLADLDTLFDPLHLPAAGLHGMERRAADGTLVKAVLPDEAVARIRPVLAAYAAARPGLLLEDKGRSLALHYRLAPAEGEGILRLADRLAAAAGGALRIIDGRKVVEIQPWGSDKGKAIAAFMAEPPFRGRRPVFAGDDTTDEDGFAAVNALGGLSIKVTGPPSGERHGPVATAAQYSVADVAALHAWLKMAAPAMEKAAFTTSGGTGSPDRALSNQASS